MARQQLLVTGTVEGKPADLTRRVEYRSESPGVVAVNDEGLLTPVGDGDGAILASLGAQQARLKVRVTNSGQSVHATFERDVLPILSRAGCNAGACHGKARGQNGFQLSLLGFDANFDFEAITREARGRRVFPPAPEHSLLLRKASGHSNT